MEYYNQNNWIEIDEKVNEIVYPEIKYSSVPPDDFLYADYEGQYFFYELIDPETGTYLYDYDTNTFIQKGIGYSVEYNGEYYWTYSLFRIPPESGGYDQSVANVWAPATSVEQFPATYDLSWKVEIDELIRDVEDGGLTMIISEESQYPPIQINSFNEETHEYTLGKQEARIDLEEKVYVTINDKVFGDSGYYYRELDDLYYDEGDSPAASDDVFTTDHAVKHEVRFDLEEEYIDGEDVTIEILYDPIDKTYSSFDDSHKIKYRNKQSVEFILPTGEERVYDISFSDDLEERNISIPTHWENGEITETTNFTFEKLFNNSYRYPDTATTDLLKLKFDNGTLNTFPISNLNAVASIQMENYPFDEFEVKSRMDGNDVILYTDKTMYYDYINQSIEAGSSNGEFEDVQGLILPWDSTAHGYIYLTLFVNTYDDYQFNFELEIGNDNKLRGDNGKYEIERL